MRTNYYVKTLGLKSIVSPASIFTLSICLFTCYNANAGGYGIVEKSDTIIEKKVDYLEQIYFSGETKAGLNAKILIALQELQDKSPTPLLAKQVTFLLEIKEKAVDAEDACDILDLLAAGIYKLDAAEAAKQGVKMPSDKAKAKAGNALESLNKLNSNANNLSSSASNLAWSSFLLSGGKSTSFISGAGKVAGAASKIGGVAGSLGQAAETGKQLNELGKAIFKKKEKACNDVAKKDIEIGEHSIPNATANSGGNITPVVSLNSAAVVNTNIISLTTTISIPHVNSGLLRVLTDSLRNKPGVLSAEKAFNEAISTITVTHTCSTDALADWLEDKFGNKFKLVDYGSGKINIASRTK